MKKIITLIVTSLTLSSCGNIFGPNGPGADCEAGESNTVIKHANNLFEFKVNDGQCIKYDSQSPERKSLPITIEQDLPEGLVVSSHAKVFNSIWWETYAFEITNISDTNLCDISASSLGAIDASGNDVASESTGSLDGVFGAPSEWHSTSCILAGQTLTFSGTMELKTESLLDATDFYISEITASTASAFDIEEINANKMAWTDELISFHFVNNSLETLKITDPFIQAKFFDNQGYFVDLEFIEPSITSEIVDPNEAFSLNSSFSHTEDEARSVIISLEWSIE